MNGFANVGVVYMYYHNGQQWVADGVLKPTVATNNVGFGFSMDISGDRIVVGSNVQHQPHTFYRKGPGLWVQEMRISDPDGPDGFGRSVSMFGWDIVIGDPLEDPAGLVDAGAAYIYEMASNSADTCEGAGVVWGPQTYHGCTQNATVDGYAGCAGLQSSPDVWFKYTAQATGNVPLKHLGSSLDTVLSVHSGCPGTAANAIACNDDFSIFEDTSSLTFPAVAGQSYMIRVSGKGIERGPITLNVGAIQVSCYANCDGSNAAPVLNVADFTCFLQKYAAADPYANCDGSVAAPVFNVADFTCFLQKYAAGCP